MQAFTSWFDQGSREEEKIAQPPPRTRARDAAEPPPHRSLSSKGKGSHEEGEDGVVRPAWARGRASHPSPTLPLPLPLPLTLPLTPTCMGTRKSRSMSRVKSGATLRKTTTVPYGQG